MEPKTTTDILKHLQEVAKTDSDNARLLSEMIHTEFSRVMATVEGAPYLLRYVGGELTEVTRGYFCDRLIALLVPGKKAPSEQSKSGEDLKEDNRYRELYGIGERVLHIYKEKWWKDIPSLADQCRVFFGNLLNYYEDMDPAADGEDEDMDIATDDDDEDTEDDVRVYISSDRGDRQKDDSAYHDGFGYDPEDEENYWEDDDDDDEEEDMSFIQLHEVEVISALSDMVTSYFGFIDNEAHTRPIKKILLDEKKRGKWESVTSIMEDFSVLLNVEYMTNQLNKHNTLFTKNMKILKVKFDAFQISLDR